MVTVPHRLARLTLIQRFGRVATAIAAALMMGLAASSGAYAYDVAKFCQPDAGEVVILVDVTTAFDDRAKDLFQRGIGAIVSTLAPGQKLKIVTIEESFASSRMLYEGCVPYCPSGLLDWLLSDCTEGIIRLETTRQQREIVTALKARLEIATADLDTSDIVRTLYYATEHRRAGAHLHLFVFSDLIENSEFMQGRTFWSRPTLDSIAEIKANSFLPDFSDATVKVFGVGRGGSGGRHPLAQDRILKLNEFWKAYFKATMAPDAAISENLYLE